MLFVPSTVEDIDTLVDVCFHAPTWLMPPSFDEQLYGHVFGKYPTEQRALIGDLQQQSMEMATSGLMTGEIDHQFYSSLDDKTRYFLVEDVRDFARYGKR